MSPFHKSCQALKFLGGNDTEGRTYYAASLLSSAEPLEQRKIRLILSLTPT